MKHSITLIFILFLALDSYSQNLKVLKPTIGEKISYTNEQEKGC